MPNNDTDVIGELVTGGGEVDAIANLAHATELVVRETVRDDVTVQERVYGWSPTDGHHLVDTVDVERLNAQPAGKRGAIQVATPAALITYAERHLDHDTSTVWAEIDAGRITVVLNDHANGLDGTAGWGDHRVTMQLTRSPEWTAWTNLAGRQVSQTDLALFLEEHLVEVVDPDGSQLLEVTQTLHATSNVTFKSSQRLHDGTQQLVWEEDLQATAGLGRHTEIPTDLAVSLRPWLGVPPVKVAGKFRFRIDRGELRLAVDLLNLEEHSRTAVEDALVRIGSSLGVDAIEGTPPAARR